jgi:dihydroorotate dehydrogenase (NAD+) catalytic subunit
MVDLDKKLKSAFSIGKKTFPNPIWLASGTAGFGEDLASLIDLNLLGGIVLKGTTIEPKSGNPVPRLVETPAGLLNAIGLQNPGIEFVLKEKIPFLKQFKVPLILNIAGKNLEEYLAICQRINGNEDIAAIELNLSCPNVEKVMDNGANPNWVENVVKEVKKNINIPIIAKLTPNVTSICDIACAAEAGGADAISAINTLLGMKIDIKTQKPVLANKMGGLSGPAIRPVAVRMIYQMRNKIKIPIVGMGGIMNKEDIFEFFCAGSDAVQLGTANFIDINFLQNLLAEVNEK